MSPNEAQLRAALRAGEGESLDVDAVVSGAVQVQRARRHRLASAVGAVIVVAGVAAGSAALVGRSGDSNEAGSALKHQPGSHSASTRSPASAPSAAQRAPSAAAGGFDGKAASPSGAAASDGATAAAGIPCPVRLPRLMLPGGGGTGQFGGRAPLFGAPVVAIKVCPYLAGESVVGESRVLTGAQAAQLVSSLNGASATHIARMCPEANNGVGEATLAIFAVTPSGRQLPVVTARLGCSSVVTNGTATRYSWSPPSSLASLVPNQAARKAPASPGK